MAPHLATPLAARADLATPLAARADISSIGQEIVSAYMSIINGIGGDTHSTPTSPTAVTGVAQTHATGSRASITFPTALTASNRKKGGGLSTGAKIGIGVGVGLGALVIAIIVLALCLRRRRRRRAEPLQHVVTGSRLDILGETPSTPYPVSQTENPAPVVEPFRGGHRGSSVSGKAPVSIGHGDADEELPGYNSVIAEARAIVNRESSRAHHARPLPAPPSTAEPTDDTSSYVTSPVERQLSKSERG